MTEKTTRRKFLRQSVAATGISLTAGAPFIARCANVNSTVRVAVAGLRWKGFDLANDFQRQDGVRVVALCDPDSDVLNSRASEFRKRHKVKDADLMTYADVRHILERGDVDVLAIATPNHWHALMTVWACQAGKHVYVEKPASHSINEGRRMVEAARKYRRLVQVGTQQLSCPSVHESAKDLRDGRWGRVLWARCSRMQARKSIGKVTESQAVPKTVDYNLWSGPAPMSPVMRQQFYYDWHWQWQGRRRKRSHT